MSQFTIGVDIGTTGTKTVLIDVVTARIVAQASRESRLFADAPGHAEADPSQWIGNAHSTIRSVLDESGVAPEQVGALSTTGMVPAVVPVAADSAPVRRALLQNDARATAQIERLRGALDSDDVLAATGSAITQQSVAPTAMWLRRTNPRRGRAPHASSGPTTGC